MSSRFYVGNDFPKNSSISHFLFLFFIDLSAPFIMEDNAQICAVYSGINCTCAVLFHKNCAGAQKQVFVP